MLSGASTKYSFIMLVVKPYLLEKQNQRINRKEVAHCLHQINQWPTWGKPGQTGCTDLLKCIDRTFTKSLWFPLDHDSRSELSFFPLQAGFVYWALGGTSFKEKGLICYFQHLRLSTVCQCPCPCTVTSSGVLGVPLKYLLIPPLWSTNAALPWHSSSSRSHHPRLSQNCIPLFGLHGTLSLY